MPLPTSVDVSAAPVTAHRAIGGYNGHGLRQLNRLPRADSRVASFNLATLTLRSSAAYAAKQIVLRILTQGCDWADLKAIVKDAVLFHFDDVEMQVSFRLRFSANETAAV